MPLVCNLDKKRTAVKRTLKKLDEQIAHTAQLIGQIEENIKSKPEDKLAKRDLKAMKLILNCQQRRRGDFASLLFT